MTLQATLNARLAAFERGELTERPTADVLRAMRQLTADLIRSGAAQRALKAGDLAPLFSLVDTTGVPIVSSELLVRGPLIVTFLWGGWCPACEVELAALRDEAASFVECGASLVAITPYTAENNRQSAEETDLTFPILSDRQNRVARAFGLKFKLPHYAISAYKQLGYDFAALNGDESWTLPLPARFVIRPNGTIIYSEVDPDYTRRPEPRELIPVIRKAAEQSM